MATVPAMATSESQLPIPIAGLGHVGLTGRAQQRRRADGLLENDIA